MRLIVKRVVKLAFTVLMLPLLVLYRLLLIVLPTNRVFPEFSQLLSLIPGLLGIYCRAAFYHLTCPGTSDSVSVGFLTVLSHADTSLSSGVYIGSQCNIGMCSVGENCLFGSGVHVLSGKNQHAFDDPDTAIKDQEGRYEKIRIGADTWIGNNATVMANVGSRCVVAAGSVVINDVEDGCIVGGNPARVLKTLPRPVTES